MLIWGTGASFVLTPFKGDFIDYVKCLINVKDVPKVNTAIGIGTTIHKFVDENGKDVLLPCIYHHLPTTDVQIFSTQTYHQIHGENSIIKGFNVQMLLKNHKIFILINIQEANPPIIYNFYVTSAQKKRHGQILRSGIAFIGFYYMYFFGDIRTYIYIRRIYGEAMLTDKFDHFSQLWGPCVGSSENQNMTDIPKELLIWNWKLGISMYHIQELMKEKKIEEPN